MTSAGLPGSSTRRFAASDDRGGAWWWVGAAVFLVVVLVAIRLAYLTSQSLWYDEGFSIDYSTGPGFGDAWARIASAEGSDRYQPLYYVLLFAWRAIFGSGEVALRALSVVLGTAAVLVVFAAALRTFGRRHAIWTLLLATTSATAVYYSQEVRPYALVLAVGALQLAAFLEVTRAPSGGGGQGARWLFWLANVLGFATSLLLGLFAGAMLIADALVERDLRATIRRWIPIAILSIPFVAYYVAAFLSQRAGEISALAGSVLRNAAFVPYGLVAGTTYGPPVEDLHGPDQLGTILRFWPSLLVLGIVVVVLLVLVARVLVIAPSGSRGGAPNRVLAIVLVAGFVLSFGFALVSRLNWQPRHSIYLLLPLFLLLPAVLEHGARSAWGRIPWHRAGLVAIVGLVVLNLYSVGHYFFDPSYARDDYRAAAAYLATEPPATPEVLLWGQPDLLAYYGVGGTIDGRKLDKTQIDTEIERVTNQSPRVVVAVNRDFYWDPDGAAALDRLMARRYSLAGTQDFAYFTVRTYELRSAALP